MTRLQPVGRIENNTAKIIGWLISLPMAVSLFGLMVWLVVSLQWKLGSGILVVTFGAAAVGVFINRAVVRFLSERWTSAVHRKVAEPTVTLSDTFLHVGDSFQITYQQQILQTLEVKLFTLQLVRRIRKVYHRQVSGIQETIERKRDRVVQSSKHSGGNFQIGNTFYQIATLTIPDQETPTLQAGNRYEEWILRARLTMGRGPAFVGEYPLQVSTRHRMKSDG